MTWNRNNQIHPSSIPLKTLKLCSNHLKRPPPYPRIFPFKMGHPWHPPKNSHFDQTLEVMWCVSRFVLQIVRPWIRPHPESVWSLDDVWTETKYPDTEALKNASTKRTSPGFWVATPLSWPCFCFCSGFRLCGGICDRLLGGYILTDSGNGESLKNPSFKPLVFWSKMYQRFPSSQSNAAHGTWWLMNVNCYTW